MHRCSSRAVAACEARWIFSETAPSHAEVDMRLRVRVYEIGLWRSDVDQPIFELHGSEPVAGGVSVSLSGRDAGLVCRSWSRPHVVNDIEPTTNPVEDRPKDRVPQRP